MDKIIRYREIQKETFEDYFDKVVTTCICKHCDNYNECLEYLGEENMECLSGTGCAGFDTTIEKVREQFLKEKKVAIGT